MYTGKLTYVLGQTLKNHVSEDKLDNIVEELTQKVVLKTLFEKHVDEICRLNDELTESNTHADTLLDLMKNLNTKIHEQNQQLQQLRQGNTLSDLPTEGAIASTEEVSSAETSVKRIHDDVKETDEKLKKNDEEFKMTMSKINRIKRKMGLSEEATMEEVERAIDELSQKGVKEMDNVKKQLHKEKQKSARLMEAAQELRQEKKTLEVKLRNKEKALQRLKTIRDTKQTIAVTDKTLYPYYRYNQGSGLSIGIATATGNKSKTLPSINAIPSNEDTMNEGDGDSNMCAKCSTMLDSAVYCSGCVKHVLYKKK